MTRRSRRRALAVVFCLGLAGCGEPEPTPLERAYERDRVRKQAEADARARERARLAAGASAPAPATEDGIRRALLEKYGAALTPFQRSALLSARLSSYAEGEALCRRWVDENRAMEGARGE